MIRCKVNGRTKTEVKDKLRALRRAWRRDPLGAAV